MPDTQLKALGFTPAAAAEVKNPNICQNLLNTAKICVDSNDLASRLNSQKEIEAKGVGAYMSAANGLITTQQSKITEICKTQTNEATQSVLQSTGVNLSSVLSQACDSINKL